MAIVDGRRVRGLYFWKYIGRNEWCATHHGKADEPSWMYSTPVEVDTTGDPREERFRYCSVVSQPVFLEMTEIRFFGAPSGSYASSWKKMPEGWREAFRALLTSMQNTEAEEAKGEEAA